jgi:hypothetical protein
MIARARCAHKFSRLAILANDCTRPPSADDCLPPIQAQRSSALLYPASFHSWKPAYLVRRCPVRVCVYRKLDSAIAVMKAAEVFGLELSPAVVTDFAIGNYSASISLSLVLISGLSRKTMFNKELWTSSFPLYSIKPSLRNLFMKKLTRERVVPIISASVS